MKAIIYELKLEEPLLATSLQGEPNSSISLDYIPGSLLRGALINRYLEQHQGIDLTRDPKSRRLFFNGNTRYLHAYPVHFEQRTVPTPRCLFHGKHIDTGEAGSDICNMHDEDWTLEERREYEDENGTFKALQTPFCHVNDDAITLYQPERTLTIHTQRERERGRSTRGQGAIFRYEALAAEQVFRGVVLIDHDEDVAELRKLLERKQPLWLGRSRSAHYGRVTLTVQPPIDLWHEIDDETTDLPAGQYAHTLLLLSDTFLPNTEGQVVAGLDATTLAQALGSSAAPAAIDMIDTDRSFVRSTIHGGFNATWKLPLQQQPALAAGSVITFTLKQPLLAQDVQRLCEQGIGLRRVEGFGRIAFNFEMPDRLQVAQKPSTRASSVSDTLSNDEKTLAQGMAERLARIRIENAVRAYAQHTHVHDSPSRSQLNELRTLARDHSVQDVEGAVRSIEKRLNTMHQAGRQQFERARIKHGSQHEPLRNWIELLLEQPEQRLQSLLNLPKTALPVAEQYPSETNWHQLALDLLATVLEKAAKEKGASNDK
jgi:CRISPR-associated protein Csx10